MTKLAQKRIMAHGGVEVPFSGTPQGVGIFGTNGSGKTLLYRMAMRSLITARGRLTCKAVLYDYKMEYLPIVTGLGVPLDQIKILNPLDARGVAFSIINEVGEDVALAAQVAQVLIPDDPRDNQPYFVRAGRELFTSLLRVCQRRAVEFHLNDLLEVARDPLSLAGALAQDEQEAAVARTFLSSLDRAQSVLATLQTKLAPYAPVASALRRNPNSFNLLEWLTDPAPGVLLLGSDVTYSAALGPLNAVFLDRLMQHLLARSGEGMTRADEVWLGIDELPTLPKLARLPELARVGRWSRAPLIITAQTVESVLEVFGQQGGYDLLAEAAPNVAFTSPNSPATRQYLMHLMGHAPILHTNTSESWGASGGTSSMGWSVHPGTAAFDSSFLHMGKPSKKAGIPVIARAVGTGFWRTVAKPSYVRKWLAPESRDPGHRGYTRRDMSWTQPLPLSDADRERLGIGPRPDTLEDALKGLRSNGGPGQQSPNRDQQDRDSGGFEVL